MKNFINTSLDAVPGPKVPLSWWFGQSCVSGQVPLSLMYWFSTCWLVSPRWRVRRNISQSLAAIRLAFHYKAWVLNSTALRNHKALSVKDYPLTPIQRLPSLIAVGRDQQQQEGRTVTTLQILRSHGVLLHKASREIKIFMIRFPNLKQMHLLSAVPNWTALKLTQPGPSRNAR